VNDKTQQRPIAPTYDKRGNPEWKSTMSPPNDSVAVIPMVPDRIIPIIFVPGVMGSNLRGVGNSNRVTWRLDDAASAGKWALVKYDAEFRKKHLTPSTMEVDDGGTLPTDTAQQAEELRRRGWGQVGAMSYAPFLAWLENSLNDFVAAASKSAPVRVRDQLIGKALGAMKGEEALVKEAVALSYRYRFPVHACGYNWLDSNAVAAERLKKCILDTIHRYAKVEKKKCEKVIIVTHSMGGLVARHCSEVLGMGPKIFGIVHGVMPAIGAPAVYRRMKAGTELGDQGRAMSDKPMSEALGDNAAEMTAVLSGAPGPLQLLPTPEYGNGWLCVKDRGVEQRMPKNGDPY
jgi:hypothetical protein